MSPEFERTKGSASATVGGPAAGICIALVALVFLVFGQTARFGFINRDDPDYLYQNPIISKGISISGIGWAFTHVVSGHWHPLTVMVLMLDCRLFGLWPGGHHLVNVALHAACAVFLYLMLIEMTGALWRSAFVAAVFAIHPLRAESVAWVAECKDVLSGMFFMLTLWAYARYARRPKSKWRYATVLLWFALGLTSKPMLVTVPCVLLLLDYWPLGRLRKLSQLPALLWEKIPFFVLTVLSCVAAVLALRSGNPRIATYPSNAPIAYVAYLWKLIYPVHLAALYPLPIGGAPAWEAFDSLLLLMVLTAGAYLLRSKRPYLLAGWFWYLGMLVPVMGVMQTGDQAYADRYTYLSQIGICIAVTWMAADWAGERRYRRAILGGAGGAILCFLLVACRRQTSYWRDSETIWTHTIECTRDNFVAYDGLGNALFEEGRIDEAIAAYRGIGHAAPVNTLGEALLQQGRIDEAIAHFRAALLIDPTLAKGYNNLGYALSRQRKVDQAVAEYRQALALDPTLAVAHCNLGNALYQQGRTDEAIAQFREALRLDPTYAEAGSNLGWALFQQGQIDGAITEYRRALRLNPALMAAHYGLANALSLQGRADEAIGEYRAALQLDPDYAEAHNNLGNALLQLGRFDEAITECREALRLEPDYPGAHDNLGNALSRLGRVDEAMAEYGEALRQDPNDPNIHNNLGEMLFHENQPKEAIAHLEKALELQPQNAHIQSNLAWMLATATPQNLRNGPRALELATTARKSTGGGSAVVLRTLAAAYAQTGDFSNAAQTARTALQLATTQLQSDVAAELRGDIKLYEAGQPLEDAR